MTADEFDLLLWRCGLTRARAAERLGVTQRQIFRYLAGAPIPYLVEREVRRWTLKEKDDQDDTEEDGAHGSNRDEVRNREVEEGSGRAVDVERGADD